MIFHGNSRSGAGGAADRPHQMPVAEFMQHVGMVNAVFHLHGVTERAVVVRTDGPVVALILPQRDIVPILVVYVGGRVVGMGGTMTGFTHQFHIVGAHSEKTGGASGPSVESADILIRRLFEICVTIQAVRFVDPWKPGIDIL